MIKRQYDRTKKGYFNNFINSTDPNSDYTEKVIEERLKAYNATMGKSKNDHYKVNVKWHNEQLYTLFVLRYS